MERKGQSIVIYSEFLERTYIYSGLWSFLVEGGGGERLSKSGQSVCPRMIQREVTGPPLESQPRSVFPPSSGKSLLGLPEYLFFLPHPPLSTSSAHTRTGPRPEPAAGSSVQPEFNNIVLILFIFIITFNLEQVIQISI